MIFLLLCIGLVCIYYYGTRNYDYWKKRGIPYEKPTIFVGSTLKQFTAKMSESEIYTTFYRQHPNDNFVGYFEGSRPALLVKDPDMIKHILSVDFKYFHHRGMIIHQDSVETLLKNIFFADRDTWKLMRQKLTPAFSSGKLKAMFPLIVERAGKLLTLAEVLSEVQEEIDVRELMARYTTDFIGACGFGIDSDALDSDSSDFRKLGKRIFNPTLREKIVGFLKHVAPGTFQHFSFFEENIEKEIVSLIKQIMSQRNYKPCGRNDFIDMMLELKQSGKIIGESIEKFNKDGTPMTVEIEFNDLLLAGQVFIFFAAGFETSSHASSILLHVLAYHTEEQARCQKEIDEILAKYDGKLSFDAVRDMKYLEMAFRESIRLMPSPAFLTRKNVKKYTFPGTDITIDPGTNIVISTNALHLDEKYFEDPEEFRPERFHPDNIGKINKYVYMPFGNGPRACIGERLGIMQSLAGVAALLSKFTVTPSKNTIRKPLVDPDSHIIQNIIGGLPLNLKLRKSLTK